MRKDFGSKDFMPPMPVLIIGTYDEEGKPNAMNAAWGGMCQMGPNTLNLFLTETHKTVKNIKAGSDFTVAIATKDTMVASDFVGIASGNNGDKIDATGWTVTKSDKVNAPIFEEFPIVLECKFISVDDRTRVMGEIINASVDEAYLTADGAPDVDKMGVIAYDPINQQYRALGEVVGDAFSVGKSLKK